MGKVLPAQNKTSTRASEDVRTYKICLENLHFGFFSVEEKDHTASAVTITTATATMIVRCSFDRPVASLRASKTVSLRVMMMTQRVFELAEMERRGSYFLVISEVSCALSAYHDISLACIGS
jgi:hypothetical protein